MNPRIMLSIDRGVLEGIAGADRARLAAAIETDLARLLTVNGVRPSLIANGPPERLVGGTLRMTARKGDATLGAEIARAIYRAFGPLEYPESPTKYGGADHPAPLPSVVSARPRANDGKAGIAAEAEG